MKEIILISIVLMICIISAWVHEKDLIRHCVEDGTLKTWDNEYIFECKAIKKHNT